MKNLLYLLIPSILMFSCGGDESESNSMLPTMDSAKSMKKESNAISQSMPSVMVIPSDALLKRINCLQKIKQLYLTM